MSIFIATIVMMVGFAVSALGLFIGIRFLQADSENYERNRQLLGGFRNVRRGTIKATKLSAYEGRTHSGYARTKDGRHVKQNTLTDQEIDRLLKLDRS